MSTTLTPANTTAPAPRLSSADIRARKGNEKIVCLTAYTAPFARIVDAHVDLIIVGDSLGMVLYGLPSTMGLTVEMMQRHAKVVVDVTERACVVVDLPFGSYQQSKEQAFESAARLMEHSNVQAVKLEGGEEMAETIAFLSARGIPVMGHIGLMPQYVETLGGFRYQGKTDAEKATIRRDAKAVEQAGAFAVVLEAMDHALAGEITDSLSIPTIGIGASEKCDGQVLVSEDMCGMHDWTPKFVREFAQMGDSLNRAAKDYAQAVREGNFPNEKECYNYSGSS